MPKIKETKNLMSFQEALLLINRGEKLRRLAWSHLVYVTKANKHIVKYSKVMLVDTVTGATGAVMGFETDDIFIKDWTFFVTVKIDQPSNISWAMEQLNKNSRVTRDAFGRGYLILVNTAADYELLQESEIEKAHIYDTGEEELSFPCILFSTEHYRQSWRPKHSDLFATDWGVIVDEKK